MKKHIVILYTAAMLAISALPGCAQKAAYRSPDGYDLNKPQKFLMPAALHEISGIAFNKGKSDVLYAEEDEHGRVYTLRLGDKTAKFTEFKPTGDFEDMAICGNQVIVLQSKGALFTMPLQQIGLPQTDKAQKWDDILPEGEYEGLYANQQANQLYVLCKHCTIDKTSKTNSGFIFNIKPNGDIKKAGNFQINVKHIEDLAGIDKIRFHPSAIAQNPATHEWYILSAVNKLLVVVDTKWKVRQVYPLNPALFLQPEGMAFDEQNNLYISNEGGTTTPANVLKFAYQNQTPGN